MSFTRLAAIALVALPMLARADGGWLLMRPPESLSEWTYSQWQTLSASEIQKLGRKRADQMAADANMPLSRWSQWKAFDTARECEAAKAQRIEGLQQLAENLRADGRKSKLRPP